MRLLSPYYVPHTVLGSVDTEVDTSKRHLLHSPEPRAQSSQVAGGTGKEMGEAEQRQLK